MEDYSVCTQYAIRKKRDWFVQNVMLLKERNSLSHTTHKHWLHLTPIIFDKSVYWTSSDFFVIKRILIGRLSQTVSFAFSLTGKLITGGSLKALGRQKKYNQGSRKMGLWSMAFLVINVKGKEFRFFVAILAKGQYLLLCSLCF